jgi:tRNA pseudouridine38-40 synthase
MRLALGVEYMGTNFNGWQIQKTKTRTVQQVVEYALSKIANHPVRVFCSGRTDTGVHAIEQIIHFDTKTHRENNAWLFGGNINLPCDVNFKWVKKVDDNFHARFDAYSRKYHYKIYNSPTRSAIKSAHFLWEPIKLDITAMKKSTKYLIGKHDFSAFRSSKCQAKSPIKTIKFININQNDNEILLEIEADAFLHHMVRNIVGTLIKIGKKEKDPKWIKQVLDSKQRKLAGVTAKPQGLYFVKSSYKEL